MANITIADLQPADFEFAELSDLELGLITGGFFGGWIGQQIYNGWKSIWNAIKNCDCNIVITYPPTDPGPGSIYTASEL